METNSIIALGIVLVGVVITLGIMRIIKQPMIIGYILAGTIMSLVFPKLLHHNIQFESFGNIGISFLLFLVGMELSPTLIKELGKTSITAGVLQVVITSVIGWFGATLLGYDPITSAYIGIGFAFSSTIVVLKLLSDKEEVESTFGRLSIGILVVQDIIVMVLLLINSTHQQLVQGGSAMLIPLVLKTIAMGSGVFCMSRYIIPKLTKHIAKSQEFLMLFAIARCFGLGALSEWAGFGNEIGALIAGITLATSSYRFEIISRIKSLKDFFLVLFFVLLGSQVNFGGIAANRVIIVAMTGFVLIIKPIITSMILGRLGHTKKNNFLTGIATGQISEFSFLLIAMGITQGIIKNPTLQGIVTLVGLISITSSSYGVMYGEKIYYRLAPCIKRLPGPKKQHEIKHEKQRHDILLFGYGRFGSHLHQFLSQKGYTIQAIDEHPNIISHLQNNHMDCKYGDASDIEFLRELNAKEAKMIISTIKQFDENMILLKTYRQTLKIPGIIILVANHIHEAIKLYDQGADYVIMPHYIGIDHTSLMLEQFGFDMEKFMTHKMMTLNELKNKQENLLLENLRR